MAEIPSKKIVIPGDPNQDGLSMKASLTFIVYSDDRLEDDGIKVLEFSSIPPLGSPYSFGGTTYYNLRAKRRNPKWAGCWGDSGLGGKWDVTVEYENSFNVGSPPEPSETDPFTISRRREYFEIIMERDLDEKLVVNSAGQKYDDPPKIQLQYPVFTIERNEYVNPCAAADTYENKVNSETFWEFPPGKVLMMSITPTTSITWDVPVWSVQYEIALNPYSELDIFQTEILDAGIKQRVASLSNPGRIPIESILDEKGLEITKPVPLDGAGYKLPEGDPVVWHWYRKRFSADFNLLRIPNPYTV